MAVFRLSENSVYMCVCVRLHYEDKAKGNTYCLLFLRGNNHWNNTPFSHKAEIFIYMTDCVADLVIVTVTVNPCARNPPSHFSTPFSLLPQVCRTKEKRNITQRRWSTYKIYKVLHQNQLPRFMRTLICCCSALLFKAPWQCDCTFFFPSSRGCCFLCALLYKISKVYQTEGRL